METRRFLMVTTFYPPFHLGGDATHVQALARALVERGHEVHVEFAPAAYRLKGHPAPPEPNGSEDGVHLHPVPSPGGRLQPLGAYVWGRSPSVTHFHHDLVERLRPDVVHYHNISLLGLGVMGRPKGAQTLYTAHDYWVRCPRSDLFKYGRELCDEATCMRCALVSGRMPPLWPREALVRRAFQAVDRVVAPSGFMKRALAGFLPAPVVHLPNFVLDPNPWGRITTPGDYHLFVGAHEEHKGLRPLVRAFSRPGKPLRLVCVGRGSLVDSLRETSPDRIEFRGWVPEEGLAALYRTARSVILPSLWYENCPQVALEALSWGTPLLVSRRGGLEELIRDGTAGASFEPTSEDISLALDHFERKGLAIELRRRARWTYERYHHPRAYVRSYEALLGQGRGDAVPDASPEAVWPEVAPVPPAGGP